MDKNIPKAAAILTACGHTKSLHLRTGNLLIYRMICGGNLFTPAIRYQFGEGITTFQFPPG
jgi:hypothetical protein